MLLCWMETVKDVFDNYRAALTSVYDLAEIESITKMVVYAICGLSNARMKAFPELELPANESSRLSEILEELQTGKPVQYVLGTTEFYGLPFIVNSSVLIPRPETEELVEWAVETVSSGQFAVGSGQLSGGKGEAKGGSGQFAVGSGQLPGRKGGAKGEENAFLEHEHKTGSILDIGTGSGCIAICLKRHLPAFDVIAIDISTNALAVARQNADLNEVKVNFIERDILNHKSEIENSKFEIIISNPPYVTQRDKNLMHSNVTDFEPHNALFVLADDPLLFYREIARFAIKNFSNNGLLFLEINESLGKETIELLKDEGFTKIELRKDMSRRDRMIKASF